MKIFLPPHTQLIQDWPKLNRIIYIERIFANRKTPHHTYSYYISSLTMNDAQIFGDKIRGHWFIENKLHWVKDAIMKEDTTKHKGQGAKNMSPCQG